LIAVVAATGPLAAQTPAPATPCPNLGEILQQKVSDASASIAADAPLTAPPSKQVGSPGNSSASTSLVSGASFTELIAAALEGGFVKNGNRTVTVDLNLFAFETLLNPQVIDRQTLYGTPFNQNLRRFGGTLTFGGQGDPVVDASGQPGTPLQADQLGDIVNWELRYRLLGTRDRRDGSNYKLLQDAAGKAFNQSFSEFVDLVNDKDFDQAIVGSCYDLQKVDEILRAKQEKLASLARSEAALSAKVQDANRKIDTRALLTLVVGGVERRQRFGPNKSMAALRGAFGDQNRGYTANLEWSRMDGQSGAPRPTTWKLAFQYSMLLGRGNPALAEPINLALDGDLEKFQDVPDAAHATIAKLHLKLDFPITKGVKLPISITWANHRDLLTNEREIRGNVGFTIDTSQLLKPAS
jgi:hypothetical protein